MGAMRGRLRLTPNHPDGEFYRANSTVISMKILIFGNSGSGKSTYAKTLAAQHALAHLDLDSIVWEPGEIAVQRQSQAIAASLDDFLAREPRWVIEGCYGELVEAASAHCSELVFLNPGLEACQANNLKRPWEPHKYASIAEQNSMLAALQSWVAGYYTRDDAWSYKQHRRIFDAYPGTKFEYTAVLKADEAFKCALEKP